MRSLIAAGLLGQGSRLGQPGPRNLGAWLHTHRTLPPIANRLVVDTDLSGAETGLTAPLAADAPAAGVSGHKGRIQRLSAALSCSRSTAGAGLDAESAHRFGAHHV